MWKSCVRKNVLNKTVIGDSPPWLRRRQTHGSPKVTRPKLLARAGSGESESPLDLRTGTLAFCWRHAPADLLRFPVLSASGTPRRAASWRSSTRTSISSLAWLTAKGRCRWVHNHRKGCSTLARETRRCAHGTLKKGARAVYFLGPTRPSRVSFPH